MPADAVSGPVEPSQAVLMQAADWYAVLRSGDASAQDEQRWREWLAGAAERQLAWRYVEDISRSFAPLQQTPDPRTAAHHLYEANARFRRRRRTLAGIAGVAGTALLGGTAWRQGLLPDAMRVWVADHHAATGMQRHLVLADGSGVWLNSASAIDVRYGAGLRRVVLVAGEIFVDTAADAARDFVVDTAHGRLRALGTRFNVRQGRHETRLAVYQGAVEIRADEGSVRVVEAGQQVAFSCDAIGEPVAARVAGEAWTRGLLVAQDMSLRDMVAELRRHRTGYIGVADEVADLRVYGNFPLADTDRTLAMLATVLPVCIHRPLPWWVSIQPLAQTRGT